MEEEWHQEGALCARVGRQVGGVPRARIVVNVFIRKIWDTVGVHGHVDPLVDTAFGRINLWEGAEVKVKRKRGRKMSSRSAWFAEYRGDDRAANDPSPTEVPAIRCGNTFCNNPLGRGCSAGHARDGNRWASLWPLVIRVAGINFVLWGG